MVEVYVQGQFLRVEPHPEETDVLCPQEEDSHNILAGDSPTKTARRNKVGAYRGINVGLMKTDMNKLICLLPYRATKG